MYKILIFLLFLIYKCEKITYNIYNIGGGAMLIKFKVSNFLSFDDDQELSLIAGPTHKKTNHIIDRNLKLLRFSSIFGSNASGKSNLLKAITFSKNMIIFGIKSNLSKYYCKIDPSNKNKITTFEYQVEIDNRFFIYGFDILLSQNSIEAEWLIEIDKKKNKEISIFSRDKDVISINKDFFDNNTDITNRLEVYFSDMKNNYNILFLTLMNLNKDSLFQAFEDNNIIIFKKLFNWFLYSLVIITPNLALDNTNSFTSDKKIEEINDIILKFETGIKKCHVVEVSQQEIQKAISPFQLNNIASNLEYNSRIGNKNNEQQLYLRINQELFVVLESKDKMPVFKKIVLEHENGSELYDFNEESDGTRRLFDLIEILLNFNNEKVFIIDELDRCLHPNLTLEFIKQFLSSNSNSQLIVTTHESRLLDLNIVRRDEVWFTNRESNGSTKLYSLEDYNERFDKRIDKAYLEGRYGGVPIFPTTKNIGDQHENS